MPSDILSLSKFRKIKARSADGQKASENRVVFGRTKAEKAKSKAEHALAEKRISDHKLNTKALPDE